MEAQHLAFLCALASVNREWRASRPRAWQYSGVAPDNESNLEGYLIAIDEELDEAVSSLTAIVVQAARPKTDRMSITDIAAAAERAITCISDAREMLEAAQSRFSTE